MLAFLGIGMLDAPPALHLVPDVSGFAQATAVALLEGSGYVAQVQFGYAADFVVGTVYQESPAAGTMLAPGSSVTITVNVGLSPIYETVPYLIGYTQEPAEAVIAALYCVASVSGSGGTVLSQSPAPFTLVIRGTTILITMGGAIITGQGFGPQGLHNFNTGVQ